MVDNMFKITNRMEEVGRFIECVVSYLVNDTDPIHISISILNYL